MPQRSRLLVRTLVVCALVLLTLAVVPWNRSPDSRSTAAAVPASTAPNPPNSPQNSPVASDVAASALAPAPANTDRGASVANATARLIETLRGFDAWLLGFRRGENPTLADGLLAARARRVAFKQLIALDPRAALAHAVPRSARANLPAEILAELETPIDAFGKYHVSITCFGERDVTTRTAEIEGRRYAAHLFGRRLSTPSKNRLPIHGYAIDDQLAIDEAPFRVLAPGELGAANHDSPSIRVASGTGVQTFASVQEFESWHRQTVIAENMPGPGDADSDPHTAAAPLNWTFGEKKVLLIRIEFPDDPGLPFTDSAIAASMAQVEQFYRDISHGRCSLRTILVPGALRVTHTKASVASGSTPYYLVQEQALSLARAYDVANGNAGTYNPDQADRTIVIAKQVPSLGFAGIASVGASGAYLNGNIAANVIAHELGHNHGIHHSHSWKPSGTSAIGAGTHVTYGDVFDAMGNTASVPAGHFNAQQKERLLYLGPTEITSVTASGTYRIFRHDHHDASGVQALKIKAGEYDYWLEHRQQSPRPNFAQSNRLTTGLQLRWGRYPSTYEGNGTYLLDLTPTSNNGMDDAPAFVGETFTDAERGLSIQPVAVGGAAPRQWIDVRIDFGATGNNRNPVIAASAPFTVIPVRTPITFTAAASDPDGDPLQVRWDFGDGRDPQLGSQVTRQFHRGGNFTVQASAFDGRGGLTTKSFAMTVDDPLMSWTRRDPNNSTYFTTLIHDGKQFIAGSSSYLFTSTDGVTWARHAAPASLSSQEMAVAGSSYVSVGFRSSVSGGFIAHSSDGLNWTEVTPAPRPGTIRSVAFGAGRFVAAGVGGFVFTSVDGINWNTISLTTHDLYSVRYAAGQFVVVGNGGTVMTSTNGLNWENRSLPISFTVSCLAYFRGKWVAGNSTSIWTSPDAVTWTEGPRVTRANFQRFVNLDNEALLALPYDGPVFLSVDGVTWESIDVTTPMSGSFATAVIANGTIVMVGSEGRILTSPARSVVSTPPRVAASPTNQFVPVGHDVTFTAGTPAVGATYRWAKNGEPIEGATQATLVLPNVQAGHNGSYTLVLTNYAGSVTTVPATLTVDQNTARLINLSIRSRVGSGADIFTVGFVVGRSLYTNGNPAASKSILMRGIGPTLAAFGVPGAVSDSRIDFFDGSTRVGTNDDWGLGTTTAATLSAAFRQVGAFDLTAGSKDAALVTQFATKAYTAQLIGVNNATGAALAELYDLDGSVTAPRLVNVSARGRVSTTSDILIGGFVVSGAGQRAVLIRAIGPGLAAFGVTGSLAQPTLTLIKGEQTVATNTHWTTAPETAAIRTAAERVGAFPLTESIRDSALLASLESGAYTIQLSGASGTTGVALLEIYEVP
jgi:hypothetical protein